MVAQNSSHDSQVEKREKEQLVVAKPLLYQALSPRQMKYHKLQGPFPSFSLTHGSS
ncbi:hypothetical protein Nmel_011915 [Mimus melanotis]